MTSKKKLAFNIFIVLFGFFSFILISVLFSLRNGYLENSIFENEYTNVSDPNISYLSTLKADTSIGSGYLYIDSTTGDAYFSENQRDFSYGSVEFYQAKLVSGSASIISNKLNEPIEIFDTEISLDLPSNSYESINIINDHQQGSIFTYITLFAVLTLIISVIFYIVVMITRFHLLSITLVTLSGFILLALSSFIVLLSPIDGDRVEEIGLNKLMKAPIIHNAPDERHVVTSIYGDEVLYFDNENNYYFPLEDYDGEELEFSNGTAVFNDIAPGEYNLAYQKLSDYGLNTVDLILNVELPEVDIDSLKKDVENVLGSDIGNYGIYIHDLKRDLEFGINEDKVLPPASISKVPTVILTLIGVDSGELDLDDKYPIKNSNKPYSRDRMSRDPEGTLYTLREYIQYSIINSDNTANATIEEILGGPEVIVKRTRSDLGAEVFYRKPHDAKAIDIAHVFEGIYNQSYLSDETQKLLMESLLTTASWLQDGIPAKLPSEAKVAHKTGQLPFYVWEDAGIVYGDATDFIIVVINEDITYNSARQKTQDIAKLVYDTLN